MAQISNVLSNIYEHANNGLGDWIKSSMQGDFKGEELIFYMAINWNDFCVLTKKNINTRQCSCSDQQSLVFY